MLLANSSWREILHLRCVHSGLRQAGLASQMLGVLLILLADVFHQLFVGPQRRRELDLERLRVHDRIDDGGFVFQRSQIYARIALDRVQLLAVRMAAEIEPELIVEANSIDDQSVPLPFADGVAVPGGIGIVGVFGLVQEDLSEAVNVALEQEKDVRVCLLDDAPGIGSDARDAGRQAIGLGIVLGSLDSKTFLPSAVISIVSPDINPWATSPIGPPPFHTPERSTRPSERRGVGPCGLAGPRPRPLPFFVSAFALPPAGAVDCAGVSAGSLPVAGEVGCWACPRS